MGQSAEVLTVARDLLRAGRREEAKLACQQVLQLEPHSASAWHLCATILFEEGQFNESVAASNRAIELDPRIAEFHFQLGRASQKLGRHAEAATAYHDALQIQPAYPDAVNNLGNAFAAQEMFAAARDCYKQLLTQHPELVETRYNLGLAYRQLGQIDDAIACYQQVLQLSPDLVEAHHNLGSLLQELGQLDEATSHLLRALTLNPQSAKAHNNLGNVLREQGRLDRAIAHYRRAIQLLPQFAEAWNNLGNACKDGGNLPDAVSCFQQAIQLAPHISALQSNLIATLNYLPDSKQTLREEMNRWQHKHALQFLPTTPIRKNVPDPERRLRVGYVSSDFREHVVGRNVWPLLTNHDHGHFEILLYSNTSRPDAMTAQFQSCTDHWREIAHLPDSRVDEMIQEDNVDILVDLALHTAGNRLLVFARKPAPVQVTFAGYPGSTGLAAIDYRLTDPYLDPVDRVDADFPEKPFRLPHSFWCYDPPADDPPVSPLPAVSNGFVTFGCLNNFCKINNGVLALWSQVLLALPKSKLILLAHPGSHRQKVLDKLQELSIAAERVEFCTPRPRSEYLSLYSRIDIGLDTLPYNGHTTSLDSYWMGVPVVTLVGGTIVGRSGWSQLSNLGLTELAATTPDEFVQIAVTLACDIPRLTELRKNLRSRMEQSPLRDDKDFATAIETAFRTMWRAWCLSTSH